MKLKLSLSSGKKIVYFDMDNTLVDFQSGIDQLSPAVREHYEGRLDEVPHIFSTMKPIAGANAAFRELSELFDCYILSTAPWDNPSAWTDKLLYVKQHLGVGAVKRLILSHNKHLNIGDFLIDDRLHNGADRFTGELIPFGSAKFPDWAHVVKYLKERI